MQRYKNRIQARLIEEMYARSLFAAITFFLLSFPVIFYHFQSESYPLYYKILGLTICLLNMVNATISYSLSVKKMGLNRFMPIIKSIMFLNAICWSSIFSLVFIENPIASIQTIIALVMLLAVCTTWLDGLITTPKLQLFSYTLVTLIPATIYTNRFFIENLPLDFTLIPILLVSSFFYFMMLGQKMRTLLYKNIENNFEILSEQETLKKTLSDLKNAESALLQEKAKALNSERLAFLGNMASGIAHEVNNPLAISGGQIFKIQNLLFELDNQDLKGRLSACLKKINDMNDRIRNIVRGLQSFAREKENEDFQIMTVSDLLDFSIPFLEEKMRKNGITFIRETAPEVRIECQKNQLTQVIVHILNNAIDAVQNADLKIIKLTCFSDQSQVQIQVSDTGHGVDPDIVDNIFDPFFTTKEVGEGTGLGLSVALGIAQMHKGNIVHSSQNMLTTFTLQLPVVHLNQEKMAS